ncbi:SCO4225 family membrane protein [Streptomyces sp. NPDC059477]|uniref:SCO4225 family membrane protein n=1 Tax=Streptomyces sp. NPDC059477 TaxID=3346847 RepID=UPI00368F04F1
MDRRTLFRFAVANPASAVYLSAVGASVAVTAGVVLLSDDPGFIGVWPVFLTAPTSLLGVMPLAATETELPTAVYGAGIAVAALVQSLVIGTCFELLRGRGPKSGGARRMRTQ